MKKQNENQNKITLMSGKSIDENSIRSLAYYHITNFDIEYLAGVDFSDFNQLSKEDTLEIKNLLENEIKVIEAEIDETFKECTDNLLDHELENLNRDSDNSRKLTLKSGKVIDYNTISEIVFNHYEDFFVTNPIELLKLKEHDYFNQEFTEEDYSEIENLVKKEIKNFEEYGNQVIAETKEQVLTETKMFESFSEILDKASLNNIYVKFKESDIEEIKKGDIYDFSTANELVGLLNEKYILEEKNIYKEILNTSFELHTDKDCTNSIYQNNFVFESGDEKSNLKNYIYKSLQNEPNLNGETREKCLNLFSNNKSTRTKDMEM